MTGPVLCGAWWFTDTGDAIHTRYSGSGDAGTGASDAIHQQIPVTGILDAEDSILHYTQLMQ